MDQFKLFVYYIYGEYRYIKGYIHGCLDTIKKMWKDEWEKAMRK